MGEAYATVVYDTSHSDLYTYSCAAAMLGQTLTAIDQTRPRVAVVSGLNAEQESILQDGGWRLRRVPSWWNNTGDARAHRKRQLWALPYERVMFLDADMILATPRGGDTAAARRRIEAIWSMPVARDGVAALAVFFQRLAPHCFNGALLLLRPSSQVYDRLLSIERGRAPRSSVCTQGFDQPVLNAAVGGDRWTRIPEASWRLLRPFREPPAALERARRAVAAGQGGGGAAGIDAFHFYFASQADALIRCPHHGPGNRRKCGNPGRRVASAAQLFTLAAWHEHAARLPEGAREACPRVMNLPPNRTQSGASLWRKSGQGKKC